MPRKKARREHKQTLVPCTERFLKMGIYAIRLSVLWINRSCKPANPAFTMSKEQGSQTNRRAKSFLFRRCRAVDAIGKVGLPTEAASVKRSGPPSPRLRRTISAARAAQVGGADRDRTDDLKLAKLALSQLSYGPVMGLAEQSSHAKASEAPPFALGKGWRATRSSRRVVGPGRLERPTSRLSGVRSNHLSYEPGALSAQCRCKRRKRKGNEGGGRSSGM